MFSRIPSIIFTILLLGQPAPAQATLCGWFGFGKQNKNVPTKDLYFGQLAVLQAAHNRSIYPETPRVYIHPDGSSAVFLTQANAIHQADTPLAGLASTIITENVFFESAEYLRAEEEGRISNVVLNDFLHGPTVRMLQKLHRYAQYGAVVSLVTALGSQAGASNHILPSGAFQVANVSSVFLLTSFASAVVIRSIGQILGVAEYKSFMRNKLKELFRSPNVVAFHVPDWSRPLITKIITQELGFRFANPETYGSPTSRRTIWQDLLD